MFHFIMMNFYAAEKYLLLYVNLSIVLKST